MSGLSYFYGVPRRFGRLLLLLTITILFGSLMLQGSNGVLAQTTNTTSLTTNTTTNTSPTMNTTTNTTSPTTNTTSPTTNTTSPTMNTNTDDSSSLGRKSLPQASQGSATGVKVTPYYLSNLITTISVSDGMWGDWLGNVVCQATTRQQNIWRGRPMTGFQLRSESPQGSGDDTALNGLRMMCSVNKTSLSVTEGIWGDWYSYISCPSNSYIVGARMQIESSQGTSDDTAANAIEFMCLNNVQIRTTNLPTNWGSWTAWAMCPTGSFVCGGQARFEPNQGGGFFGGDDTAFNGLRLLCCFDYC